MIQDLQEQLQRQTRVIENLQEQDTQHKEEIVHLKAQFISQDRMMNQHHDRLQELIMNMDKINSFISFTAFSTEVRTYDADDVVQFDGIVVNDGGFFNSSTGYFTCPYTGYYLFSVSILAQTTFTMGVDIRVNGTLLVGAYASDTVTYGQAAATTIAKCEAGQMVWVRSRVNGNTMNGSSARYSRFTGALLRVL